MLQANILKMVEAAGVEPASAIVLVQVIHKFV